MKTEELIKELCYKLYLNITKDEFPNTKQTQVVYSIHVLPSHDNLNKKEVIARLTVDKIVTFMQVQIADISEEDNILREVISNRVLSEVFNYGTMNAKKDIQKYRVF